MGLGAGLVHGVAENRHQRERIHVLAPAWDALDCTRNDCGRTTDGRRSAEAVRQQLRTVTATLREAELQKSQRTNHQMQLQNAGEDTAVSWIRVDGSWNMEWTFYCVVDADPCVMARDGS